MVIRTPVYQKWFKNDPKHVKNDPKMIKNTCYKIAYTQKYTILHKYAYNSEYHIKHTNPKPPKNDPKKDQITPKCYTIVLGGVHTQTHQNC